MSTRHYIQLPLITFREMFPEQAEQFPKFLDRDLRYLVRYDYVAGLIELGYAEDKWLIE